MSDISSLSNNMLRITGLATGMDTDSMVKKMMAAENLKLDKMKQNRQYTQWRQDGLRDIIKDFRDLRQSYLLIDSPADTNMIKTGTYSGSSVTVTDDKNNASTAVTATALPGAVNGTGTVKVTQIAKSAAVTGMGLNESTEVTDLTKYQGATLTFGAKSITLGAGPFANINDLVTEINTKINDTSSGLGGRISVSKETINAKDYLRFNQITSENVLLTDAKTSGAVDISELSGLIGRTLSPTTSTKLEDLGISSDITFTIKQGTNTSSTITLSKDKTIQDLISTIYNAESKDGDKNRTLYSDLQVSFSDLTKKLTIQTRNTGSSQSLEILADPANTASLAKLGLTANSPSTTQKDAIVEITPPGSNTATTITKSTNNFTVDNMTYNLVKDPNGAPYTVNLTIKADAQESVKKIKAFVDKYNSLVDKIYDKISEKKNYDYKPLTDDQKSEMKEEQIKTWEDKAKQGVLKNDGDLQNILNSMRNAFMDSVKSAGISLKDIGIETYGGYEAATKPGQFKVDETKLKNALETRGDQVMKIFTASTNSIPATKPDEYSSYADNKWQDKYKYDNMGIFKRLENIIDTSSVKSDGSLLKKAGYQGTSNELTNSITKQLKDQDKAIYEMNRKLATKQEKYYQMFARLETAMNNMNAQQSWLAQQLGGK